MTGPFVGGSPSTVRPVRGRSSIRFCALWTTPWTSGPGSRSGRSDKEPRAFLDAAARGHVFEHVGDEVRVAVFDLGLASGLGRFLARPGGEPRGPVAVELGARRGN